MRTLLQALMKRPVPLVLVTMLAACDRGAGGSGGRPPGSIDAARLRAADAEPGQWMAMGRTYKGERFSPLTQVNDTTATRLGFAWEYEARSHRGRVEHGQESAPIMVDGVLYASGPWGTCSRWMPAPAPSSGATTPRWTAATIGAPAATW